jgi:hypothetical protein
VAPRSPSDRLLLLVLPEKMLGPLRQFLRRDGFLVVAIIQLLPAVKPFGCVVAADAQIAVAAAELTAGARLVL